MSKDYQRLPKTAKARLVFPDDGAAMLVGICSSVSSEKIDLLLLNVAPISLGIKMTGGVMMALIKCNSTILTKRSKIFLDKQLNQLVYSVNQPSLVIKVYEGEGAHTEDNILLGKFKLDLSDSPSASCGAPQIEVTFDFDANYSLRVSTSNRTTGRSNHITIANGLTKEEIDHMAIAAKKYKGKIMVFAINIFTRY